MRRLLILGSLILLVAGCRSTIGVGGNHFRAERVRFDDGPATGAHRFLWPSGDDPYLDSLRAAYPLDALLADAPDDLERAFRILDWTNGRWVHSGMNSPRRDDALGILREAEAGGRFPCFAYAIVLRDQLRANGIPARTLYLKTRDARRRRTTPGHVVTEAWLADRGRWAFLDGQFNVLPLLDGEPLDAVGFQAAVTRHAERVTLRSGHAVANAADYLTWVYPYLFHFDAALDQRYGAPAPEGPESLMLLPLGRRPLRRIRFWDMRLDGYAYTRVRGDFYPRPENP